MLLALTGSARAHEICYLDICYLIRHSSAYSFHFLKTRKAARKNEITPPIKYLNFKSSKNLSVCHHIDLYIQRTQNIRNGENQLLLGKISSHKAVSTKTILRSLVHVLSLAGIDISTFKGHSKRTISTSKPKALGVPARVRQ